MFVLHETSFTVGTLGVYTHKVAATKHMTATNFVHCVVTVSGEANFAIEHTGLTVRGVMQPVVAQNIVQTQANVDKGLWQAILVAST